MSSCRAASPAYVVQLEVFSGPMDLLLQLIEKRELDITLVSLAAVTDQYVAYVESLPEPDPEQLADFLLVAAKLLAIKATVLLNRPITKEEADDTVGDDLIRALEQYRLFQRVAALLREWEQRGRGSFARNAPAPIISSHRQPDGLRLEDLIVALRRLGRTGAPEREQLTPRTFTIQEKIAVVETALSCMPNVLFDDLLDSAASKVEIIATFLALLELIKLRKATARQEAVFGSISISRLDRIPEASSKEAPVHALVEARSA